MVFKITYSKYHFWAKQKFFFYADNPTVVPKVLKKDQEGQPPCQLRMSSIGNLHHGGNAGLRKIGPFNCNPIVVFAAGYLNGGS